MQAEATQPAGESVLAFAADVELALELAAEESGSQGQALAQIEQVASDAELAKMQALLGANPTSSDSQTGATVAALQASPPASSEPLVVADASFDLYSGSHLQIRALRGHMPVSIVVLFLSNVRLFRKCLQILSLDI